MAEKTKIIHEKVRDSGGAIYGLGVIGAIFYFFQQAVTFPDYIWGFIKAILWPAFVVYSLLGHLNM